MPAGSSIKVKNISGSERYRLSDAPVGDRLARGRLVDSPPAQGLSSPRLVP